MIGYKVTARNEKQGYSRVYRGSSEGDPVFERKAIEQAAKQVLRRMAKWVVGSAGGPAMKVSEILAAPLAGFGTALGNSVVQIITDIEVGAAEIQMINCELHVTLTGEFEAKYRVVPRADLKDLPLLLALIPKQGTEEDWDEAEYMGESVLESVWWAHINYLNDTGRSRRIFDEYTRESLEIEIDL